MGLKVMVFDDDQTICSLIKDVLTDKGHEVATYSNPTEFPLLNEEKCPCAQETPCADIIIADIVMPNMGGEEVLQALRQRHSELAVLLVSGYSRREIASTVDKDPHTEVLAKPFRANQLVSALEKVMGAN